MQWHLKMIGCNDYNTPMAAVVVFANKYGLKPGEIISLGHHVSMTGNPYAWSIMYYADKELE